MKHNQRLLMRYKVKELRKLGLNKSQISRSLGIDRGTVRKYSDLEEATERAKKKEINNRPIKLSGYETYVKELLEEHPYLSSAQVEDRLKENYPDLPKVHSKTVYNFVQKIRLHYQLPKAKQANFRRYQKQVELAYGEEAQVDFGVYNMLKTGSGRVKVYFFAIVLSRSRYKYVYLQNHPFTTETTCYAHQLAFSYFGGMPKRILYDQDRVLVKSENLGDVLLTEGFKQFADSQAFEAVFCRKADPQTKGKIENVVKFVKQNFLRGRKYTGSKSLQQACESWLDRTGNGKKHSATQKIPSQEWEIEKPLLLPYSQTPEKPVAALPRYKLRKDNTVCFRGNFYSVPIDSYQGVGTQVLLRIKNEKLYIHSTDNQLIAEHRIPVGKGQYVHNRDHVRPKSKTLTQLHNTLLHDLGGTPLAQEYLKQLEQNKGRYYHDNIRVISSAVENTADTQVQQALTFCLENKLYNGYRFVEVLRHYRKKEEHLNEPAAHIPELDRQHKPSYDNLSPQTSDIKLYEQLI